MLTVSSDIKIHEHELKWQFARSSGPGGQNVNKVNSKAVLIWDVKSTPSLSFAVKARFMHAYAKRITKEGLIVIASDLFRDQQQNMTACREKLVALILKVQSPPKRRKPTKPTRGAQEKRIAAKKRHSVKKQGRKGDD